MAHTPTGRWLTICLITMLVIDQHWMPATALVEDILDVIKLGKEVTSSLLETWEIIEQTHKGNEVDIPFYKIKEKKILSRMSELSRQIDVVESESTSRVGWTIDMINENMIKSTQLQLQLHELSDLINRVSTQQNLMRTLAEHETDLNNNTIINFADWTVSPNDNAIQGQLERLHLLIAGSNDLKAVGSTGLLELIANNLMEAQNQVCATRQSAQQVLYQLYTTISLTELKGYSMIQFSWMLLKSYGRGNFTRESQLMRKSFEERARKTQELLRKVMKDADRQVWRCDPHQHVEGETYEAVTRLLQGYIENEVDMNTDQTCRENCAAYTFAENHGCFKDMYCAKQPRCSGKILNCQYVDSDMWICPSKASSTRRYEYIEYENGRVLGQKGSCSRGTTKVDSWWRWLFWHCSYCMCMCDEASSKSDRYFSLRDATSNITANHVLTGLRFRKINRIIHLQIQEGQLLPRGAVNASTIQWRPVSEFRLTDRAVRSGEDYHTMNWKNRAIDTDDLKAPDHHVVTGIRFRTVGSHLNLEIRITETDFETGKLLELSSWVSNDNTTTRNLVTLSRPDIPTRTLSKSVPTSATNSYIEFVNSDLDADLAQTTVPYIDIQDVESIPPVALAGAGIHHKGQKGFGGFVAPKLFTYDFAPHIEVQELDDPNANKVKK